VKLIPLPLAEALKKRYGETSFRHQSDDGDNTVEGQRRWAQQAPASTGFRSEGVHPRVRIGLFESDMQKD